MSQHLQGMINTMQQDLKHLSNTVSTMMPKAEERLDQMKEEFWGDFKSKYERERAELMV